MGNCCTEDFRVDGQEFQGPSNDLGREYAQPLAKPLDPSRRAIAAKSMPQIPKASRSCFVCYACAATGQVRKGDIPHLQGVQQSGVARPEYANRLLGRIT
ncbi:unnamed protein product [Durusdinium trenchii]|uniref:Uncharacterized protein n=1 Tax=Durusdinium trenchii TaxID=1381693 RepID=A0ABP0QEA3_9DINO